MKIVICWGGISGYMAACWRELAARDGIDLLVLNFQKQHNTAFDDEQVMAGIAHKTLPIDQPDPAGAIRRIILDHKADVVSVSGWIHASFIELARDPALAAIPFVMVSDTPLRGTWRQRLARLKVGKYLDRMSRVIVPGERAWQFAKFLKVPEHKIRRAAYGVDYNAFWPLHTRRASTPGGWPRKILFTGRYVEEKGLHVLLDAYGRYRRAVSDPWLLDCCGMGSMKDRVRGEGVTDLGFVQPAEMAQVLAEHGVFVLPSLYDPWPLAIVEACAAGLPVICTEACGSAVELVRTNYSGLTVTTDNVAALADGLIWAHRRYDALPDMGARAQNFAAAYSAQAWADRWEHVLGEIVSSRK
jgi:glycosyltransferase involved in cell wall biosynthesis